MQDTGRVVPSETILNRIRGEYREMPGMRLRREQAQRLWNLDEPTCTALLDALVDAGFLTRSTDGMYGLPSTVSGATTSLRMAAATITSGAPGAHNAA